MLVDDENQGFWCEELYMVSVGFTKVRSRGLTGLFGLIANDLLIIRKVERKLTFPP